MKIGEIEKFKETDFNIEYQKLFKMTTNKRSVKIKHIE